MTGAGGAAPTIAQSSARLARSSAFRRSSVTSREHDSTNNGTARAISYFESRMCSTYWFVVVSKTRLMGVTFTASSAFMAARNAFSRALYAGSVQGWSRFGNRFQNRKERNAQKRCQSVSPWRVVRRLRRNMPPSYIGLAERVRGFSP